MIYMNELRIILLKVKRTNFVNFETIALEHCKLKLRINSDEWLKKNNYIFIGKL